MRTKRIKRPKFLRRKTPHVHLSFRGIDGWVSENGTFTIMQDVDMSHPDLFELEGQITLTIDVLGIERR